MQKNLFFRTTLKKWSQSGPRGGPWSTVHLNKNLKRSCHFLRRKKGLKERWLKINKHLFGVLLYSHSTYAWMYKWLVVQKRDQLGKDDGPFLMIGHGRPQIKSEIGHSTDLWSFLISQVMRLKARLDYHFWQIPTLLMTCRFGQIPTLLMTCRLGQIPTWLKTCCFGQIPTWLMTCRFGQIPTWLMTCRFGQIPTWLMTCCFGQIPTWLMTCCFGQIPTWLMTCCFGQIPTLLMTCHDLDH